MNPLENAKSHFKTKFDGELKKLKIDEWQCDVYYRLTYPFAKEAKIMELQQQGKTVEALVESVIQKALTPDGKQMFHPGDRWTLLNEVDPNVVLKIASTINNATINEVGEVEKN